MSDCPVCHRWAPPDSETGYDADELCPYCKDNGWTEDGEGRIVREDEDAEDGFTVAARRVEGRR